MNKTPLLFQKNTWLDIGQSFIRLCPIDFYFTRQRSKQSIPSGQGGPIFKTKPLFSNFKRNFHRCLLAVKCLK